MEPHGEARLRLQHVYVHSFGSHRCGSIIRYGKGCQQAERGQAGSPLARQSLADKSRGRRAARALRDEADPGLTAAADGVQAMGSCGGAKHVSPRCGYPREEKADAFDFPFPSRNVDKVIKRKKKSWLKVWKVISKMLEENEKFRHRLLTCSQSNGEGMLQDQIKFRENADVSPTDIIPQAVMQTKVHRRRHTPWTGLQADGVVCSAERVVGTRSTGKWAFPYKGGLHLWLGVARK